jgi:hypothetical protein
VKAARGQRLRRSACDDRAVFPFGRSISSRRSQSTQPRNRCGHLQLWLRWLFWPPAILPNLQRSRQAIRARWGDLIFLPANDFTDNDYTLWKNFHPSWYRPYFKKLDNGTYDISYPEQAVPTDQYETIEGNRVRRFLIRTLMRYTFTANTFRSIKYLLASNPLEKLGYSGYFDATREQQEAALYFVEKLVQEAAPRQVMILVIPNREDMKRIRSGKSYKDQYWFDKLRSMATSAGVELIDMADHMPDDYASLFLPCDNHWNALGHMAAAKLIAAKYRSSISRQDKVRSGHAAELPKALPLGGHRF